RSRRGGSAGRQSGLPAPLGELHRAILRQFLHAGTPPTREWVLTAAGRLGLAESAIADLATADLVHLADGVVTVAYPFSGTPTRQIVELDGLPAVHAMCAIDALGIPAMAGRPGRIAATDPRDGAAVVVSACGRRWTWDPDYARSRIAVLPGGHPRTPGGSVVLYGHAAGCGPDGGELSESMCPHTTFHASRGSAQAYLADHPGIEGEITIQEPSH
ncbi:MAG: hypothetical protein J2P25_21905, partial [Nocardiopsaceae bacterium]|nr:hypothetical protein [Nocardiopsaceae bacterium]